MNRSVSKNRSALSPEITDCAPQLHWLDFSIGQSVLLTRDDGDTSQGFVSEVMPDATAIWIYMTDICERRMFCPEDQVRISET